MRLNKLSIAAAAILAGATVLSAGAATAAPTCIASNFPAISGGESSLKVSCLIPAATAAGFTLKVKDYGQARWHSGAARTTAADGNTTNASATITSASAHFAAADVNHQVTSSQAGIPVGAFIKSVTNGTTAVLDVAATAAQTTGVFTIENSAARHVTDVTRNATTLLTSATAHFTTAIDVGAIVTGTGIKPGTKINSTGVSGANTTATLSQAVSQAGTGGYLTINAKAQPASNRQVSDLHNPAAAASTTIISATAGFAATDVGLPVIGAVGIPAGTYITVVTNATTATVNQLTTLGATANKTAVIGKPDVGAPENGGVVSVLTAALQLSPSLVASSDDCAQHTPEGFSIQGSWQNPGSFAVGGVLGTAPSNSVGQIVYTNVSAPFAAYVVKSLTGTYTVNYVVLPTALAQCPSTALATAFTFGAITVGQSNLATGSAAPATGFVRGYADFVGAVAPANTAGQVTVGANPIINLTVCPVSRQLNGPTTWVCGQG